MNNTLVKIAVPLVGLSVALVVLLVSVFFISAWWASPPPVFGFGVGPEQPIAFPHTVHVQEAGIDCQFCHRKVSTDEAATIPAVQQCLFCHDFGRIDGTLAANAAAEGEIQKVRDAFYGATSEDGTTGDPTPIDWARVHRLPDHVQFVHEPHISQGFSCSTCHGDIQAMAVVKQVRNLKMRDCVDCHRANSAPTDCATCHY